MWRTRWWMADGRNGDQPQPPPLLVFNRISPPNPGTVIAQPAELTQRHGKGTWYEGGFHVYDGALPIVVTGMKHLKEHGPAGPVFRRFGRPQNQTLFKALGNPRRRKAHDAHDAHRLAEYAARQREHQEELRRIAAQHKAEREARRRRARRWRGPSPRPTGSAPASPPTASPARRDRATAGLRCCQKPWGTGPGGSGPTVHGLHTSVMK
ncbi:hypothetical protein [Streptomyces spinosus]|uniref:hypothetical protein n=1 Tax=Streptomyces spinosus TaxID=2872623 RepID=UPI001CEDDF68|nr:hypothetical protein [Streptomyces spinosus]